MTDAQRELLGACGLYCGLCPRFQSTARSRCPGCRQGAPRTYCSVFHCVEKRGLETCALCAEVPCGRLRRALKLDQGLDSFVSHRPILDNLSQIRKDGVEAFLDEQARCRELAQRLIAAYDAGRSKTLICTACALLPRRTVERIAARLEKGLRAGTLDAADRRGLARQLRLQLEAAASDLRIDLRLRRKKT